MLAVGTRAWSQHATRMDNPVTQLLVPLVRLKHQLHTDPPGKLQATWLAMAVYRWTPELKPAVPDADTSSVTTKCTADNTTTPNGASSTAATVGTCA